MKTITRERLEVVKNNLGENRRFITITILTTISIILALYVVIGITYHLRFTDARWAMFGLIASTVVFISTIVAFIASLTSSICLIGHNVDFYRHRPLMEYNNHWQIHQQITALLLTVIFVVAGIPSLYLSFMANELEEETFETHIDIYHCDAPFGHYWAHIEGSISGGIVFSGEMDSELRESYTIKTLSKDNELKTYIVDALDSDTHVILLDCNSTMYARRVQECSRSTWFGAIIVGDNDEWNTDRTIWYIYIPDPNIY